MVIQKQWKQIKSKLTNHPNLGLNRYKAWEWAKSYWYNVNSYILAATITYERLKKWGYVFLSDYLKVRFAN